jgi:class 3 adenylate cyclase/tetratricopeptide (TPR) repeat protein
MLACPSCGQENVEGARFCNACGAPLSSGSEPTREVRKTVTVLFSDVAGSTELGERVDPESMRRVLTRYFGEMQAVLERHGGTVEKFIGDAVMAVFGLPQVHEDDALRAVRAAVEMREALLRLNEEFERERAVRIEARTGINTGEVVAGEGQTLATGDAVNVAARLEQAAAPGEILLGAGTHALVRDAVRAEAVDPLALKGKSEAVPAFRLVEVIAGAEPYARRFDTTMVGRDEQLQLLLELHARAVRERRVVVATVLGEPGIGKSRLARELVSRVAPEALVLFGRCLPYGEGITYWPLVEMLTDAAAQNGLARIEELVAPGEDSEEVARALRAAVGSGGTASSEEIFWAVRMVLQRLAAERPLVVVVDDLQWAEATFFDLLEHVVYLSREAPILLLCLARPELREVRPGWPGESLQLEPLGEVDAAALMNELLAARLLGAESRARIAAGAQGNPLFVEQMLAMVEQHGDGDVTVPPTIQALLAARLDRLGAEARGVIERAAVVGQRFSTGAVRELSPPGGPLTAPLLELVRRDLVRPAEAVLPGGDSFEFVHLLVRDAAYAALSKELRADLHERLGAWLARVDETRDAQHDEIVGYHFEQAWRYRSELTPGDGRSAALARLAADRLARAGRRAAARGDTPASVRLLSRAAQLLPRDDALRLDVALELSFALAESGDLAAADEVLEDPISLGDAVTAAVAVMQRRRFRLLAGADYDAAEARIELESELPELQRAGNDRALALAWLFLADVYNINDRIYDMGRAGAVAAAHARRAGDHRTEADATRIWAGALVFGPTPVSEACRELELLLAEPGLERMREAAVAAPLAALRAMQGASGEAATLIGRARSIYEDLGLTYQLGRLGFVAAIVWDYAGRPETAEHELRSACAILHKMGEMGRTAGMAVGLADLLVRRHDPDAAAEYLELAEGAGGGEFTKNDFYFCAVKAALLSRRGDPAAEGLARRAVDLAARSENLGWAGRTFENAASVALRAGRRDDAIGLVRRALERYERKGDVVAAARARQFAAEIGEEAVA